ncbi:MAG: glutathione S-transferase [Casimicrobiaceae bacterium]
MLKLFYGRGACSRASHIALEETGQPFEPIRLNLKDNQQRTPEYLAINSKGRVPALVTDRGILTETPAILAFIGQTFPDAHLVPEGDAFAFAQMQSFNSYLCSTVHVAHAHKQRGARWTDDPAAQKSMTAYVPKTVGDCFDLIEREMFKGPWVLGEQYSVCDPYLFTLALWLEGDGVDPALFPKVNAHRMRMQERPAVARVLAREEG